MSYLPGGLRTTLREVLSAEPTRVQYIGGGSINQTARIEVGPDRYFVKWKTDAPAGFFEAEARGLDVLRAAGVMRVPTVIEHGEAVGNRPAFLILEWIDESRQVETLSFSVNFARALAALHRITGPSFGLDHDNYIGDLPQSNAQTARWIDFYRDQRIGVQLEIARGRGRLTPERERAIRAI